MFYPDVGGVWFSGRRILHRLLRLCLMCIGLLYRVYVWHELMGYCVQLLRGRTRPPNRQMGLLCLEIRVGWRIVLDAVDCLTRSVLPFDVSDLCVRCFGFDSSTLRHVKFVPLHNYSSSSNHSSHVFMSVACRARIARYITTVCACPPHSTADTLSVNIDCVRAWVCWMSLESKIKVRQSQMCWVR